MIVLFYAVGCIVFGFLVSLVVMQMDKSKAKKRKRSMDQNGANIESKVIRVISNKLKIGICFQLIQSCKLKTTIPFICFIIVHNTYDRI